MHIFKICSQDDWHKAQEKGFFMGLKADIADGFIHCSTEEQVSGTLAKHFEGEKNLLLLKIDADRVAGSLKWERSRNGALFPHLYAALPLDAITDIVPLTTDNEADLIAPVDTRT